MDTQFAGGSYIHPLQMQEVVQLVKHQALATQVITQINLVKVYLTPLTVISALTLNALI